MDSRADDAQKPVDLDELERLARAATPERWVARKAGDCEWEILAGEGSVSSNLMLEDHDALYIAAANPQAVLALIARLRALSGAVPTDDDEDYVVCGDCAGVIARADAVRRESVAGVPPEQGGGEVG